MDIREDYLKFLRGELDPFIFEKKLYTLTGKELPKESLLDEGEDEILKVLEEEF